MRGGDDEEGWFHSLASGDEDAAVTAIREGSAASPQDWAAAAVESGLVTDEADYYRKLRTATIAAAQDGIDERAEAADERLKHQIRALEDIDRISNELVERIGEWATATGVDVADGLDGVIALSEGSGAEASERGIASLASIVAELHAERDVLRDDIERTMHEIAPNLTALAGPLLGARLIALAGDLETLAKMPSGTVQVLGAEDALFAHLNGGAPPPKHGIIFIHEFVRGTDPAERGSAARALAGKLAIAARIDHYAGDRRPELERDLQRRIDHIRGSGQ